MPTFENIALQGGLTFQVEPLPLGGSLHQPNSFALSRYANNIDFVMETSDFTVEWFHKIEYNNGGIFSYNFTVEFFGSSTTTANMFVRANSSTLFNVPITDAWGVWDYYAITRKDGIVRLFRNGIQLGTDVEFPDYIDPWSGNFTFMGGSNRFFTGGYMTNFHWVKGNCLYTSDFSPPTSPILPVTGSKLLLRATDAANLWTDSSGTNKVVLSTGRVVFSTETPFSV